MSKIQHRGGEVIFRYLPSVDEFMFDGFRDGVRVCNNVPRADIVAEVESGLNVRIVPADAIVIERSELPTIEPVAEGEFRVNGHSWYLSPEDLSVEELRAGAFEHLALAEYVDEAEVTRVVGALAKAGVNGKSLDAIARDLVANNVRVVTS